MNIQFCIKHQELVDVETLNGVGTGHLCALFSPDWGWCEGPFAASTPPENFSDDWDLELVEPDGDELFVMNRNAEQLLSDFE